jgi:DNA processing protein
MKTIESDLISDEKLSALRLIRSENVGIKTFFSLLKFFGSANKAINKVQELSIKGGRSKPIKLYSKENAIEEIEKAYAYGAEIIHYQEDSYPKLLQEIADFPPIITVFGKNRELLNKDKVAIVGSRNASLNGTRFAYKIANEIAEHGYVIVSGLARGIDSYVHRGSLEHGTIAIIAGGIDNIYPPENKDLYQSIADKGLVIAENPFGTIPKAQNFPQRNRLISGLSKATIVIEGSIKSGSLITANFALEQNREVFAVPGFPMDTRYSGTNKLIKQGAYLLETVEDVLHIINARIAQNKSLFTNQQKHYQEGDFNLNDKVIEKDLDKVRNLILSILSVSPITIDDLIRKLNVPVGIVMLSIIELELAGVVQRTRNNEVVLLT